MRLCSHVITNDTGLAPNPFHGYCTSALCTPSHMNAKLKEGEWIVGISPKRDGNRLVYAMRISQVLSMNQYFHDEQFGCKKPKADGTISQQCGDNIYYQVDDCQWKRLPSRFHNSRKAFLKDVGNNLAGRPVFISEHFYYFGRLREAIPAEFAGVVCDRQGIRYKSNDIAGNFVRWLEAKHKPGILATPLNQKDRASEPGTMLTDWIDDDTRQGWNEERSESWQNPKPPSKVPRGSGGCS
jgi:hypothetical protein